MPPKKTVHSDLSGERYLAVTYRPVGLNPIGVKPDPYGHDLTQEINLRIEEALKDSGALTNVPQYHILKYRIINVTATIDPRVSTQPGLDSMIYVAHIAYWYQYV